MTFPWLSFSLIAILLITATRSDICDQCMCAECDSVIENCSNDVISTNIDEIYICDGRNEKFSNQTINLNNIQWPRRNVSISASFNNLNITYLTK